MERMQSSCRCSNATSAVASAVRRRLWRTLRKALFHPYRPELHYMRGPGPKWHEKHDQGRTHGGRPAMTRTRDQA
jgi:hypothetical protein